MLYNIIYSKTFYILLCIIWLCDSDYDICDHPVIGVMPLSCFVTCVTITYNITSYLLPNSKIKKSKMKPKIKLK